MALLLSILLALGRLSSDNEIIAFKTTGVSLYQMIPPVATLAVAAYIITSVMMVYVFPWGNTSFRGFVFRLAKTKGEFGVKETVFNDDFKGLVLYVGEVSPVKRAMKRIFIADERQGGMPAVIVAKEGAVFSDPSTLAVTLRLFDGTIHRTERGSYAYQKIEFTTYDLRLDLTEALLDQRTRKKKFKEMTLKELISEIKNRKGKDEEIRKAETEIHKKFSIPFACLIFALIGIPLAVQPGRSGKSYSFVIGLVVILFYYLLLTVGEVAGEGGLVPPLAGVWLPNLVMGPLGLYLFVKVAGESPIPALQWLGQAAERAAETVKRKLKV
jgi:lipopolysaccharide export system permease protein